jgi:hypothetical protein
MSEAVTIDSIGSWDDVIKRVRETASISIVDFFRKVEILISSCKKLVHRVSWR